MATYPQRIGEPDCRDYLRTGRCKYGESCKYHHPANVESGGGIKTPLDPSEPPFPIRPNEPPCQYYLKHGTCKFGQTCKFHHPTHILTAAGPGNLNGTILLNVGGERDQLSAVQILPQRPNEPDCIYFLRNGRCKYGATCKYHHPLNTSSFNQVETAAATGRRQQEHTIQIQSQSSVGRGRSSSMGSSAEARSYPTLQVIQPNGSVQYQEHRSGGHSDSRRPAQHIVVSDGPIAVMTVDQGGLSNSTYPHVVSRGATVYYAQTSAGGNAGTNQQQQEHSPPIMSSPVVTSSSVASSYETAMSSMEYLTPTSLHNKQSHQQAQQAEAWHRSNSHQQLANLGGMNRRTGSGGSLHAYGGIESPLRPPHHHHYLQGQSQAQQQATNRMTMLNRNSEHDGRHSSSLRYSADGFNQFQEKDQERRHRTYSIGSMGSVSDGSTRYSSANGMEPNIGQDAIRSGWPSSTSLSTSSFNNVRTSSSERLWDEGSNAGQVGLQSHDENYQTTSYHPPDDIYDGSHRRIRGDYPSSSSLPTKYEHQGRRRSQESQQRDRNRNAEDDGLSMMTSALLTMLDTQEGGVSSGGEMPDPGEKPTGHNPSQSSSYAASGTSSLYTERVGDGHSQGGGSHASPIASRASSFHDNGSYDGSLYSSRARQPESRVGLESPLLEHREELQYVGGSPRTPIQRNGLPSRWSPTWQSSSLSGSNLHENAQAVSTLHQTQEASSPSHAPPDTGLFLP